jgi:hypothetical protein
MPTTTRFIHRYVLPALALVAVWALTGECLAWQNNNKQRGAVDREQQDVRQAEQRLRDARKQAEEAKQAVAQATAAHKRANDHVGDTREKVEREQDMAPALVAARRQSDLAKTDYETARAELLKALGGKPEYQAASAARELAKQKLAGMSPGAAASERETLAKQFQQAGDVVRNLEKAAIAADPTTSGAEARYQKEMAELRTLVDRRNQAVDQDARLTRAKSELKSAKEHLENAKAKLGREVADIERAEAQLRTQQKQKQDAEARLRDAKNKNNNNKNNKNKKK